MNIIRVYVYIRHLAHFNLFLQIKDKNKKMNSVFVPSHGIGEVYIDAFDMRWRMLSSSFYNFRKNIPFFKLLLDMGSLMMRCYIRLDERETDAYNIILSNDFKEKTTYLMKSY